MVKPARAGYRVPDFRKFKKNEEFQDFSIFFFDFENFIFLTRHSTSPPCGNQVDGLPHDVHTETVAKPARLGPTKNGATPPKNDRVSKVLHYEVYEEPEKML